jgi:PKD repeat protein
MEEIKVMARDERRKESEELIITVEVKANTQPVAVLTSNISEVVEGGFVTFDVDQSYDPDDRADLEYRFSFGDAVYSDWVAEGQTVRLYRNAFFNGPDGGELQIDSGEEVLRDKFGIMRVFKLVNGKLLEVKDSVVTTNGYNYSLPETSEERTYTAQLMAREISESGNDAILASSWSDPVAIKVYRAENVLPVARAQAGLLVGTIIIFNDIVDYAKTGDTVTYTAANSYDPDGDDALMTYEWRLIDSRGGNINLLGDKYAKTFERTYNEPGTYTAILTVTDERGGYSTWQVDVIVTKSDTTSTGGGDEGYDTITLFGAAFIAIAGLVGGALALNRMRGGDDDIFEDVMPGPMELQCPSCGGLISITTTQRPIQVGCPICASQFVLRE